MFDFKKWWINKTILLVLIVFFAAVLRFYQLSTNPPSLTWDEVAWGYNAYSLGLDGRDEFGRFLPYDYLESFGDFKPPMYAYLSILPVKIFGLTEFATRFASAFFGVLTVLLTYFLAKEIFSGRMSSSHPPSLKASAGHGQVESYNSLIALIAAAIMTISPWHIMLSRAAFEANVATFFLVLGVFLFLRGMHKNPWLLCFSALAFVSSMYTFNTSRIVAPLLVIMLVIGFWKQLFQHKKQTIMAGIVGFALLLPIIPFLLSDQAKLRFKEVNIFSDVRVIERSNQEIANDKNAWWSKIIHNRRFEFGQEYLRHYFDNLSPEFLFIKGDGNPKFSIQSVGQMYLWELPFLIMGALFLFRRREGNWWIIPLWLVLGIVPAATARETPHALRIEATLPTFQILVAYGIVSLYLVIKSSSHPPSLKASAGHSQVIKSQVARRILIGFFLLFVSGNFVYFLHDYLTHYPKHFSREWQYGYKEAISYINEVQNKYDAVYMTESLGRPYAYLLFYKHYDPTLFRKEAMVEREALGFVNVLAFNKYYFGKTKESLKEKKKALYFDTPEDVPPNAIKQKEFYLLNGEVSLVGYTLN